MIKTLWPQAKAPTKLTLRPFMGYEWITVRALIRIEVLLMSVENAGLPNAQATHDGGTLKNRDKYQSFGISYARWLDSTRVASILEDALKRRSSAVKLTPEQLFSLPAVKKQLFDLRSDPTAFTPKTEVLALFFSPEGNSGKAEDVAKLMTAEFKNVTGVPIKNIVRNSVSDAAAASVASKFGETDEVDIIIDADQGGGAGGGEAKNQDSAPDEGIGNKVCSMHSLEKVIRWSLGTLEKRKNREQFEPFPEGLAVVMNANRLAKWATYGKRKGQLKNMAQATGCPTALPHFSLCGTRIAAAARMLTGVTTFETAYKALAASMSAREAKQITLTDEEWGATHELEGIAAGLGEVVRLAQVSIFSSRSPVAPKPKRILTLCTLFPITLYIHCLHLSLYPGI